MYCLGVYTLEGSRPLIMKETGLFFVVAAHEVCSEKKKVRINFNSCHFSSNNTLEAGECFMHHWILNFKLYF